MLHRHQTNCRNCGAPIHGSVCEYCGTFYGYDLFAKVDINLSKEEVERMVAEIKKQDSGGIMLIPSRMPLITRR